MGTPGAWTTDDATDDFYYSLNTMGPHYWFIVMDMNCDQTQVRNVSKYIIVMTFDESMMTI